VRASRQRDRALAPVGAHQFANYVMGA
jgi:hypothetical protein